MFTVYHSNQLDLLKTLTTALIAGKPLSDPFAREIILVQSHGMAQWLQIELANELGIAANIEFPLPASFIWQMFTKVLPGIPQESAFSKDAMTWKLMWLLPPMLEQPEFSALKGYLSDDEDMRKRHQLAGRIADLFDQYLVYRPEWLQRWQQNELVNDLDDAQIWQAPLWRALIDYTERLQQPGWHRANLYQRFIDTLNQPDFSAEVLPHRVFICGISALPPVYLQALQALGQHIDVHLMFTNPCRYYWADIQDYAFLAKLQARKRKHIKKGQDIGLFRSPETASSLFDEQGNQQLNNPLLASWGKLGRDNLYLLAQLDKMQEVDAFVDIESDSLLHRIQSDILSLDDRALIINSPDSPLDSCDKRILDPDDRSISTHVCHSAQREVEVLYDQLLAMLDNDPTLTLRDIIVMVADIDNYTPYIEAVFGNAPADRYLPYAISDRSASQAHPVLTAFLSLLDLPDSRFTAEDILTLLEVPALAMRFQIDEDGLRILRQWVEDSGIRWGLDDDMVSDLELPPTGQHTWQFGLTRMLLGYAMDSQRGDYQGVLPYDESSGLIASLAGQLAEFLMQLAIWRNKLKQSRTLTEWSPFCRELVDSFFITDVETEPVLALIEQQWQKQIGFGLEARYQDLIPLTILRDELSARLDNERISQRFLAGPINFCTLMPMRSIPFKVVCLLGMNDGVYPRTLPPLGFDLMARKPLRGDRSRRDDDRYLFLEALISAQQKLYISFIGQSIQDNSPRYPSVLISELLEYISQSHRLPDDRHLDLEQSALKVYQHLLCQHARVPFSEQNFVSGSEQQSYASEWLPAAGRAGIPHAEFSTDLDELELKRVELEDLRRFYRNPVRAFFQQRLRVNFSLDETELPDEEPFLVDNLQRYQMNVMLLNSLIEDQDPAALFSRARAAGELPFGAFGELFWQGQSEDMAELAEVVKQHKLPAQSIEFEHNIAGLEITGWLHQVQADGILRWRPAELSVIDGMLLWLDHLVYCINGGSGESRMFGRKNSEWRFAAMPTEQAEEIFAEWLNGYVHGLSTPLLLLPKSAWAWLTNCYDQSSGRILWDEEIQQKARQKLIQVWQGGQQVTGEGEDPYLMRLFRVMDDKRYQQIISDSQPYLFTLIRHKLENQKSG
ncbi:exodeoxyribonuclease V subunit gamma [Budvicia aquatica]|uniref:RecBCD enzyme subunit RecC n=1 Tax=Budvicia aquatica TaxID=82979 RepID=A0A2C6C6Y1_9GAMM|nr:exodeoxyribonuclease V subunit gamma [Budvicia aquatica]PHI32100.1 exonuclease V subunit gamma [Budvicia aquatica]VFS53414.1 Exodeoxyribonuclease V gamma chain [Budvicia aquatica]